MTLVELMFSAAILAVVLLAVYSANVTSVQVTGYTRENEVALFDLESGMEDIVSVPFNSTVNRYPNMSLLSKYTNLNLPNEQIQVSYVNPAADPLEIRLTITWTGSDNNRTHTMKTATMKTR